MGVINTIDWLKKETDPLKICKKLTPYFSALQAKEIHYHLVRFGMYRTVKKSMIEQMEKANLLEKVQKKYEALQKKWNGPDIPIFILPVDESNGLLTTDFQGRSGLSFPDKMFLFLSPKVSNRALTAVLIHEYHHICRLHTHSKRDEEYTLLDTMILEGLAEYTVMKKLGEEALTHWMTKYSKSQLNRWWNQWIKDHQHVKRDDAKYVQLLFGKGFYPTMLGYALGYEMVKTFYQENKWTVADTFSVSSESIAKVYETQVNS